MAMSIISLVYLMPIFYIYHFGFFQKEKQIHRKIVEDVKHVIKVRWMKMENCLLCKSVI